MKHHIFTPEEKSRLESNPNIVLPRLNHKTCVFQEVIVFFRLLMF